MAKSQKITRTVKILDAVLKEDEGSDDDPRITQYIWLQLQDVNSEVVYSTNLSLEDINKSESEFLVRDISIFL